MKKLTKEDKRLAAKRGWTDGHSGSARIIMPYQVVSLSVIYDDAYWEGLDASKDSKNPYALDLSESKEMGWFLGNTNVMHFFRERQHLSACHLVDRKAVSNIKISPDEQRKHKSCIKCRK